MTPDAANAAPKKIAAEKKYKKKKNKTQTQSLKKFILEYSPYTGK